MLRYQRQTSVKAILTLHCLTGNVDGSMTGNLPRLRVGAGAIATLGLHRVAQTSHIRRQSAIRLHGSAALAPNGCVFPVNPATGLAKIPQTAWSAPSNAILPYIPAPTVPGAVTNNYSNNSQRNIVNDDKFGERVDFNNQKTGNWSWYYHLDNTNVQNALAGFASVPGFPTVTPSRAQEFVMSNTKTFGATAVNEARHQLLPDCGSQGQPGGEFCQPVVAWVS